MGCEVPRRRYSNPNQAIGADDLADIPMTVIVHCTSVHPWDDTRIFHKMAVSSAAAGFDAHLVALDRKAATDRHFVSHGVHMHVLAASDLRGRFYRATAGALRVVRATKRISPRIIHFHDPEMIPWVGITRWGRGVKTIYDAHENLPGLVFSRDWIPSSVKPLARGLAHSLEYSASRFFDQVVAATPAIASRFTNGLAINNYPIAGELMVATPDPAQWRSRPRRGIYVGNISGPRGIVPLVQAIGASKLLDGFDLVGDLTPTSLLDELRHLPGCDKITYHGKVERGEVARLMGSARFGVVTFLPHPNHVEAQPNKLFEYMSAGLPIVASDFPLWREILEGVAEFADPGSPASVAAAIDRILSEDDAAQFRRCMTGIGRVGEKLNWTREFERLRSRYEALAAAA